MAKDKKKVSLHGVEDFNKLFEDSIITPQRVARKDLYYSTRSPNLDVLLGGGFRKGQMVELQGANHSGKTTIALSTCVPVLEAGGEVLYIDAERAIDDQIALDEQSNWLYKLGIDPFNKHFTIFRPRSGEHAYAAMKKSIVFSIHDLIIVDSLTALIAEAELAEGDKREDGLAMGSFGRQARLNSDGLKNLNDAYSFSRNKKTTIIFLNQLRMSPGGPGGIGAGKKGTGGEALPFYATQRLKTRVSKKGELEGSEIITKVAVTVLKNRFNPIGEVEIQISSERGVDYLKETIDILSEVGFIYKAGAWYNLYDRAVDLADLRKSGKDKDPKQGFLAQLQGMAAVKEFILTNNLLDAYREEAINHVQISASDDNDSDG